MTDRERFVNVLNYQPVDHCFYAECLWTWPETYERWEREGYDRAREPLFDTDRWDIQLPWFFPNPPFEREIVAEGEATISYINEEGILLREMKGWPHFAVGPCRTECRISHCPHQLVPRTG